MSALMRRRVRPSSASGQRAIAASYTLHCARSTFSAFRLVLVPWREMETSTSGTLAMR
jgi:hypothetical protein